MDRLVNFSAGPAQLPDPVLEQIRDEICCLPGVGSSILEISHRCDAFLQILADAKAGLKRLAKIPDSHEILFLQGGSRLQFSMAAQNLIRPGGNAGYVVSGAWSQMAYDEAKRLNTAELLWDGSSSGFSTLPTSGTIAATKDLDYVYFCSNETIHGVQFPDLNLQTNRPQVCDMSSDFLSRPIEVSDFSLLFACAQKNSGIAGLTIAIVDRSALRQPETAIAEYLNYQTHIDHDSLYNTPPTFAIYVLKLMVLWLEREFGSLAGVTEFNRKKSDIIYAAIDRHPETYRALVDRKSRSRVNVACGLTDAGKLNAFLDGARQRGMTDLRGHRSVGGIRVSLYNAMPIAAAEKLAVYLDEFAAK